MLRIGRLSSSVRGIRFFHSYPPLYHSKLKKLERKAKRDSLDHTSKESIIQLEIQDALATVAPQISLQDVRIPAETIDKFLFAGSRPHVVAENVPIVYQTSDGDGLGIVSDAEDQSTTIVKVPKTLPGDHVKIRFARKHNYYAEAVALEVSKPSQKRKDDLVICSKFSSCSGCQFQMLPYESQLEFKKEVIKRAYKFFYPQLQQDTPGIWNELLVMDSPMQYSYRTKLTPHYQYRRSEQPTRIGFNSANHQRAVVDVDNCPIATYSINKYFPMLRESTLKSISSRVSKGEKVRGETLILRESIRVDHKTGEFEPACLTNHKNVVTERVGDYTFQFPASEFFQVNNSILPDVLNYIRFHIQSVGSPKYLVDTYCGSGFFGISLSDDVPGKVFGIEVSKTSIKYANHNAKLNGLDVPGKIQFIDGDAQKMFTNSEFVTSGIRGEDSVVIIDPSRKGSNKEFLSQLLEFKPKLIVYVSCNVFTQARDLATFAELQRENGLPDQYRVKEVIGFDFFPQTKHVETVAILERIDV